MEIRKRWSSADSALPDKNLPVEEAGAEEVQITEVPDIIPGIPPRSRIHAKGSKKVYYYFFSILAFSVMAGGVWWWVDQSPLSSTMPPSEVPVSDLFQEEKEAPADKQVIAVKPAVEQPKPLPVSDQREILESNPAEKDMKVSSSPPQAEVFKKILKHKVEQEETLYRISQQYYHTGKYASFLARYNGFEHPSDLKFGTYIRVPFPPVK